MLDPSERCGCIHTQHAQPSVTSAALQAQLPLSEVPEHYQQAEAAGIVLLVSVCVCTLRALHAGVVEVAAAAAGHPHERGW